MLFSPVVILLSILSNAVRTLDKHFSLRLLALWFLGFFLIFR